MMETMALVVEGLTKSYGDVRALRGVDLEVRAGEIVGFLGPNGAGKTTTIRCLLDLIRPDSGSIRVFGIDPQADPVAVCQQVGYLPGELALEPNQTAAEILRYFSRLRGNRVDWAFVRTLAHRLELDLNLTIKNMSKGNKQKVAVVQALMARPPLLLLDEPTSGLDPLMQQEVYRLIKEAQAGGATVFFSSHIIAEVETIAERVAIIRQGVIVEEAEPEALVNIAVRRLRVRFQEPVEVQPLAAVPGVTILSQDDSVVTVQVAGEMDGLVKALAAYPVSDLETERPSLEEIFLSYYEATGDEQPQIEEAV
ncbi:MAG: ABC transporter ATP-binding protein [Chloroflexi bacterium]|nr:ABC transporter ATP-binding protein [Chloroflexota bacterium]